MAGTPAGEEDTIKGPISTVRAQHATQYYRDVGAPAFYGRLHTHRCGSQHDLAELRAGVSSAVRVIYPGYRPHRDGLGRYRDDLCAGGWRHRRSDLGWLYNLSRRGGIAQGGNSSPVLTLRPEGADHRRLIRS